MFKEQKNISREKTGAQPLDHYADRLRILHEINLAILEARSLDAISEVVLRNTNQLFLNCEWICLTLFDKPAQEAIILAAHSNNFATFKRNEHLPLESFKIANNSHQQNNTYIVGDLHTLDAPTFVEKTLMENGVRSLLSVLLITRSRLIGSFNLGSSQKNVYTEECVDIARKISSSLAIAIENAQLIEAEHSRNQELLAMTLVSTALRMTKTRSAISPIILDQLQSLFHADSALLARHDFLNHELEIELGLGYWAKATGKRVSETEGVSGKVLTMKRPYLNNDIRGDSLVSLPNFVGKISAVAFAPLITQRKVIGTLGIGRQTPIKEEELRLLVAIADMVANTIQSVMLTDDLQRSNIELALAYDSTLEGWARALELRDHETEGHTQRVTALTMKLARSMGVVEKELIHFRRGALLHDIGKMGIPDHILLKPGPLNDAEWDIMRKHPRLAYEMLSPIQFLRDSLDIPYCHHEKWDGSGYPRHLKGEQIPFAARIFAVADVFDALTSSSRPYRDAWSREKALKHIRSQGGIHFDPQVADTFLMIMNNE